MAEELPVLIGYSDLKLVNPGKKSDVYKCIEASTSKPCALKRIHSCFLEDGTLKEQMLQEINLLKNLKHTNIVAFQTYFIKDDSLFIQMEYASNGDLKQLLKSLKKQNLLLHEKYIWYYFTQLVNGVSYMQESNVLHCDLKPANILLTKDNIVKITDFGLATTYDTESGQGKYAGTPYYMAPEVLRQERCDFKADVWSMGCILYELVCLVSPFQSNLAKKNDLNALLQNICSVSYPSIPEEMEISNDLRSLVTQLLTVDVEERISSADLQIVCKLKSDELGIKYKSGTRIDAQRRQDSKRALHDDDTSELVSYIDNTLADVVLADDRSSKYHGNLTKLIKQLLVNINKMKYSFEDQECRNNIVDYSNLINKFFDTHDNILINEKEIGYISRIIMVVLKSKDLAYYCNDIINDLLRHSYHSDLTSTLLCELIYGYHDFDAELHGVINDWVTSLIQIMPYDEEAMSEVFSLAFDCSKTDDRRSSVIIACRVVTLFYKKLDCIVELEGKLVEIKRLLKLSFKIFQSDSLRLDADVVECFFCYCKLQEDRKLVWIKELNHSVIDQFYTYDQSAMESVDQRVFRILLTDSTQDDKESHSDERVDSVRSSHKKSVLLRRRSSSFNKLKKFLTRTSSFSFGSEKSESPHTSKLRKQPATRDPSSPLPPLTPKTPNEFSAQNVFNPSKPAAIPSSSSSSSKENQHHK